MRNHGYSLFFPRHEAARSCGLLLMLCLLLLPIECFSQQAQQFYRNAQYQEALRALEMEPPSDAEGWLLKGKAHYQLGDFQAAGDSFQQAIRLNASSSVARNWNGRALGMQAEQGNPLRALGLARKARDEFQAAVELDPSDTEALSDLFSYYLAAPSFLGGGVDKAKALAEQAKPLDTALYALLQAQLAEKAKEYAQTERWFLNAIEAAPAKLSPLLDLAHFYTRRDRLSDADAVFARARKLQKDSPRLLFEEANLLVRSSRNPEKARDLLRQYEATGHSDEDPSPFDVKQLRAKLEKLESERRNR